MLVVPLLAGVLLLGGEGPSPSDEDIRHDVGGASKIRHAPASLETIQQQLDEADRYIGDRTAARFAVWDVAVAGSQAEHDDIGQGVLILVVAVARSESDLPLRRVYVVGPKGNPVSLLPIGTIPRELLQGLRISGKSGGNVWAGVYFLLAARRVARGPIFADFATRTGFELGTLPPEAFGTLEDKEGKVQLYLGNVAQMAKREYHGIQFDPDFAQSLGSTEGSRKEQSKGP